MKAAAFILAVVGLLTGIIAARIWWRAAMVPVAELYTDGFIPPGPEAEIQGWTVGLLGAFSEAASLNKNAAKWTAVSVVLNGAAAVLGTWPF
jgi:hypothetical protein